MTERGLIDEAERMALHPGVVFEDGPSGRRAALESGPDVWQVVKFVRQIDQAGSDAVTAAVETLRMSEAQVRVAMDYYSSHPDEIDDEIRQADEEWLAAEATWLADEQLLAWSMRPA
jgi:hypothetical protein